MSMLANVWQPLGRFQVRTFIYSYLLNTIHMNETNDSPKYMLLFPKLLMFAKYFFGDF